MSGIRFETREQSATENEQSKIPRNQQQSCEQDNLAVLDMVEIDMSNRRSFRCSSFTNSQQTHYSFGSSLSLLPGPYVKQEKQLWKTNNIGRRGAVLASGSSFLQHIVG